MRDLGKYWKDRFQIFTWKNSAFHFSGSWGGGGLYTRWGFDPEFSAWKSYFEQWLSCRASGNVLTIPRLYVGGCIPLRIRDGYMEMTGYAVLQPDSWLGFGSEESVTYCRSSPAGGRAAPGEERRCQQNERVTTAWWGWDSWVWQTPSVPLGVIQKIQREKVGGGKKLETWCSGQRKGPKNKRWGGAEQSMQGLKKKKMLFRRKMKWFENLNQIPQLALALFIKKKKKDKWEHWDVHVRDFHLAAQKSREGKGASGLGSGGQWYCHYFLLYPFCGKFWDFDSLKSEG